MSKPIKGRDGLVAAAFVGGMLVMFGVMADSGVGHLLAVVGAVLTFAASLLGEHQ